MSQNQPDKDPHELATKIAIWMFVIFMAWILALGLYALTMWVHRVVG